ncbi:hypothetical protein NLO98_23065, partial [Pseudomonas syringae]|nr:hypothetical protein [Pseudomonas syringae]
MFYGVSERYDNLVKLRVDGLSNLSIIRTSSGADGTKNSLIINELDGSVGSEEASMKLIESGEKRQLTAGCNAVEFA